MEKETKKVNKKSTTSSSAKATKNSNAKKVSAKKSAPKKAIPKKVEEKEEVKVIKEEVKTTPVKADKAKVKAAAKKNKVYYANNDAGEIVNFLIIILIIALLCGGIYLATRAFITKDLFNKESKTEEVVEGAINYDVATMGTMLNRPYDEYYVVIYNASEGEYISDMSSLVYSYKALEKHLHMYTVDLSNALNKTYYDPENVNDKAKTLSEVKVGYITLIKVKGGSIVKYITDYSKMKSELGVA